MSTFTDVEAALEEAEFMVDSTRKSHSIVGIDGGFTVEATDTARGRGAWVLETISVIPN